MKISNFVNNDQNKTTLGKDAYEMAEKWGCHPSEAAQRMQKEGWLFSGYNDNGQECYLSPDEEIDKIVDAMLKTGE